jgi:magnesium chelatase family protein
MAHLRGEERIAPYVPGTEPMYTGDETEYPFELGDVRGQEHVQRALEVAASGGIIA